MEILIGELVEFATLVLHHFKMVLVMTCNNFWILLTLTQASIMPFNTHGNAFKGAMSMLSNAIAVKTVAAVS